MKHIIEVKSVQVYRGSFDRSMIGTDFQTDLGFEKEKSLSFECTCGERFYKQKRAEAHLEDVADDE